MKVAILAGGVPTRLSNDTPTDELGDGAWVNAGLLVLEPAALDASSDGTRLESASGTGTPMGLVETYACGGFVTGNPLEPLVEPSLLAALDLVSRVYHVVGDRDELAADVQAEQLSVIFHLAAAGDRAPGVQRAARDVRRPLQLAATKGGGLMRRESG